MRKLVLLLFMAHWVGMLAAQVIPLNVHRIFVKDGLNDAVVTDIGQDRFGNMWFTSISAVHRYNGREIKRFYHISGDSTSSLNGTPSTICRDSLGRMWIGYTNGLALFDEKNSTFRSVKALEGLYLYDVSAASNNKLYLFTSEAILCYNPQTEKLEPLTDPGDSINDSLINEQYLADWVFINDQYYLSAEKKVWCYNTKSRKFRVIEAPMIKGEINRIRVDAVGNLWLSDYRFNSLIRLKPDGSSPVVLDSLLLETDDRPLRTACEMISDAEGHFWISTPPSGMIEYNPIKDNFTFYGYDNHVPINLQFTVAGAMFRSKDGLLWNFSFSGVDYFHPKKNIFGTVIPHTMTTLGKYARTVHEDKAGNRWFSAMDGIAMHEKSSGKIKTWIKKPGESSSLPLNSSRMLAVVSEDSIWIATGTGMVLFNPIADKFIPFTEADGLPQRPYFSVNTSSDGTVWFGGWNEVGLHYISKGDKRAHPAADHPVLKKYAGWGVRIVFEDSKGRIWIGFENSGIAMYNPSTRQTSHWTNTNKPNVNAPAGNKVIDIKEDRKGNIWFTTWNGVSCLDPTTGKFRNYTVLNGLPSSNCNSLVIDSLDRVWVGTANGLVLIDVKDNSLTIFDESDGLLISRFMEHPGAMLSSGEILLSTQEGFISFDPLKYAFERQVLKCTVSGYAVAGKEYLFTITGEESASLSLEEKENFFIVHLSAPNFIKSRQTWFAYKLEGFDKDWVYSQNPDAQYTNVPGGKYKFYFKASTDPNNWDTPVQSINVEINLPFYKQWWFRLIAALSVALIFYSIFRYRAQREREITELNNRAQLLEKEKSVVQYENLKQQLNPHFLFNSLTSLGVLINSDQKLARQFVDQMSKIYRYILKSSDTELVPLLNEINFVKSYIHLQQTRFSSGFEVNINLDEEVLSRKIVPVTIQNLLENAIKHNIIDPDSPLVVDILTEGDYFIVTNNIQRKGVVESSNKRGILQLKALYKFLSEKPIVITETPDRYTIKIPLI